MRGTGRGSGHGSSGWRFSGRSSHAGVAEMEVRAYYAVKMEVRAYYAGVEMEVRMGVSWVWMNGNNGS